jgi:hypothetical protein
VHVPSATKLTVRPSLPTVHVDVLEDTDVWPSPVVETLATKFAP